MITADELGQFPLFAYLTDEWQHRIATTAAEIFVSTGEYLIREGEMPSFFVLLSGALAAEKEYGEQNTIRNMYSPGDFYGEIPILLNSVAIASLRATEPSRVLRLDKVQFKDMIASSRGSNELVVEVMIRRVKMIQSTMQASDPLRVRVVGSRYSNECRDVREFLSQNHVSYKWSDHEEVNLDQEFKCGDSFAIVDQEQLISCPLSTRRVAEALGMPTTPSKSLYDVVIVGGGPAGLAAAVNGASEGLQVLLVEKGAVGGQAACSSRIENYPGFPTGISGSDLGSRTFKQALHFGAEVIRTREVQSIFPEPPGYCVEMDGGIKVQARSLILATGVSWRTLQVPGLRPLIGKGVLYGAARTEAHAIMGRDIFVVGAGNSAGQAAMFFSAYAGSVTLLARGESLVTSMSQYLYDQIGKTTNIYVETRTELISASGDSALESICTSTDGVLRVRKAHALYIMVGTKADSSWMPRGLQTDQQGYVLTGRDVQTLQGDRQPFLLETNLAGMFCAGDIRHGSIKRVASAMGEGSMAISFIHKYLELQMNEDHLLHSEVLAPEHAEAIAS